MSLDIYIEGEPEDHNCYCPKCDNRHKATTCDVYYEADITHNLTQMADAAGIYQALWRPDEIGIKKAKDLVGPLSTGLESLKADRAKFEAFNPPNGWGSYENFIPWIENYLRACREYPEGNVRVSR